MNVLWERDREVLTITIDGKTRAIHSWSKVRNELNKQRPKLGKPDVVYATNADGSQGVPYMPRPFPLGKWKILGVQPHLSDKDQFEGYLYPFFVITDACQKVMEWSLTADKHYDKPTGRMVWDYAYGQHWAQNSITTLGCGRFDTEENIRWYVAQIEAALARKEEITLEVV